MVFRILETPLLDVLLILLLLRILFPRLFISAKRNPTHEKNNPFVRSNSGRKSSAEKKKAEGEYIDYEEIK